MGGTYFECMRRTPLTTLAALEGRACLRCPRAVIVLKTSRRSSSMKDARMSISRWNPARLNPELASWSSGARALSWALPGGEHKHGGTSLHATGVRSLREATGITEASWHGWVKSGPIVTALNNTTDYTYVICITNTILKAAVESAYGDRAKKRQVRAWRWYLASRGDVKRAQLKRRGRALFDQDPLSIVYIRGRLNIEKGNPSSGGWRAIPDDCVK